MDKDITLAKKLKNIVDNNRKKETEEFADFWMEDATLEYTTILEKIEKAVEENSYHLSYWPNIPYDAYYLIYDKLKNDGFKYGYVGNGYIGIWWDGSHGEDYTHRFY